VVRSPAWRRAEAARPLLRNFIGRQNAAWILMSSEMGGRRRGAPHGLAWKVCEPDDLLPEARRHAEVLASRPISSLMADEQTLVEPDARGIAAGWSANTHSSPS